MHDFDRTMSELELEEWAGEDAPVFELPYDQSPLGEGEFEFEMEGDPSFGDRAFSDEEELELASELLTTSSDEELDQFLGGLIKKAQHAAGRFMKSGVGRSLKGALRGLAKKALPIAGSIAGSVVPGLGTAVGGALGSAASKLLEPEYEYLSPEEMEFEAAKRIVRIAGAAAKNATRDDDRGMPPHRVAQAAVVKAVQRHAPRLLHRERRPGWWHPHHGSLSSSGADLAGASETAAPQERDCGCGRSGARGLSQEEELEAASDLIGAVDEDDIERCLERILRKVVGRNGTVLKKGVRRQLHGALKAVARKVVPNVKRAVHSAHQSIESAGAAVHDAAHIAQKAGRALGLELEGLSPEDQEFEAARQVVRLASSAGAHAARASHTAAPAPQIARSAMVDAARKHAPGLLASHRKPTVTSTHVPSHAPAHGGRWIRKGSHIVLLGAYA